MSDMLHNKNAKSKDLRLLKIADFRLQIKEAYRGFKIADCRLKGAIEDGSLAADSDCRLNFEPKIQSAI
jgi:hypothetical protein